MQMDKNDVPINVFLDLSKAFDTTDHTILLNKLRYCSIGDASLLLFKNYFNNHKHSMLKLKK